MSATYSLHGQTPQTKSAGKHLGVTITHDLSCTKNLEAVAARRKRTTDLPRRNFEECTPRVKSGIYTTVARPTLEQAPAVWDPQRLKDSQQLEKVQRRAARYVFNNHTHSSSDSVTSLLEKLEWASLEERRRHVRLGMLCRMNNNVVDIYPTNLIHHSDSRTRGAQSLHQEPIRLPVLFNSFSPRTVLDRNHLPVTSRHPLQWGPSEPDLVAAFTSCSQAVLLRNPPMNCTSF